LFAACKDLRGWIAPPGGTHFRTRVHRPPRQLAPSTSCSSLPWVVLSYNPSAFLPGVVLLEFVTSLQPAPCTLHREGIDSSLCRILAALHHYPVPNSNYPGGLAALPLLLRPFAIKRVGVHPAGFSGARCTCLCVYSLAPGGFPIAALLEKPGVLQRPGALKTGPCPDRVKSFVGVGGNDPPCAPCTPYLGSG